MCLYSKCPMLQNTSTPWINWVHYEENAKICATHGNDQPCNPRYTVYTFQCSYATVIGDGWWPLYRHMTLYTPPLHTTGHNQIDRCHDHRPRPSLRVTPLGCVSIREGGNTIPVYSLSLFFFTLQDISQT